MSVFEKMAHIHDQKLLRRASDDPSIDQVGDSNPASGVVTPSPDPADKRLPSIMHSFFGQVRATSNPSPPAPASTTPQLPPALQLPAATVPVQHHPEHPLMASSAALPPTAPSSPPDGLGPPNHVADPSSPPHPPELEPLAHRLRCDSGDLQHAYPTPPLSNSSSIHARAPKSVASGGALATSRKGSAATAASRTPPIPELTAGTAGPSRERRHTFAMANPLTNIITPSTVHAAHLSNPATAQHPATTPTTPTDTTDRPAFGRPAASSSYFELKRLTEGAIASHPKKTTPPLTPRTSSNEVPPAEKQRRSPSSNEPTSSEKPRPSCYPSEAPPPDKQRTLPTSNLAGPSTSDPVGGDDKASPSSGSEAESMSRTPSKQATGNTPAPVGPPKGKLFVKISEARGLRPSLDPYVVCVFEWNEYISKGPRAKEVQVDPDDRHGREESGGIAIKRSGSDMGKPMAIPMKSRQSSNTSNSDSKEVKDMRSMTDPRWDHEATFDVVGKHSEIDVSVYDRSGSEAFLGHVRFCPLLSKEGIVTDGWFNLEPRAVGEEHVSGEIYLAMRYQPIDKRQFGPEDFQVLKLIGKGTFGQVYQVRKKDTQRIYAMKVLSKKVIVQKKEVAHTLGERNILVRTAMADSPFIVGLKFSFQTPADLYLVTDYMSGGELFWHLQKEGRFNEQRAKFYIAELILALQHLHRHDIVYRDLKPENILLDANGHIALCDFGLSKANLTKNDTTNTFCGTTEYLAPEVLLDEQGYTKMVDFWSLGVLVFEMCCGWSPFYAEDTQQMYKNIAFGKVRFPRDALSTEGRNFVKGLLNRNPKHRLGANQDAEELQSHPFFSDINWDALAKKNVVPPFKPKLKSVLDTSNFDPEFTNALDISSSLNARPPAIGGSTPLSPGMQANFKGFTFVDESSMNSAFGGRGRDDLERMDEDVREEDDDWDIVSRDDKGRREDRMSGIVRTGGGDDGVFNSNFDDMM